jgi:hypothetical protein
MEPPQYTRLSCEVGSTNIQLRVTKLSCLLVTGNPLLALQWGWVVHLVVTAIGIRECAKPLELHAGVWGPGPSGVAG